MLVGAVGSVTAVGCVAGTVAVASTAGAMRVGGMARLVGVTTVTDVAVDEAAVTTVVGVNVTGAVAIWVGSVPAATVGMGVAVDRWLLLWADGKARTFEV